MANQTAEERRIYQNARTHEMKAADEANCTPRIIELQRRERELGQAERVAMKQKDHKGLKRIRAQYKEVMDVLIPLIKHPRRRVI